ncbi:uncharacterized protein LOC125121959 [Phacochoerus africanus]|uniref:uncharacterized protein LOC125121959 n=1 Tax=Phacochoerus africanus TaxID=41426 RepID=UPI001FDA8419|nr:uncharacterized protein LOC125121959 [Phacochoerus africanus]
MAKRLLFRGQGKKMEDIEAAPREELLGDRHDCRKSYAPLTLCVTETDLPRYLDLFPVSPAPPLPLHPQLTSVTLELPATQGERAKEARIGGWGWQAQLISPRRKRGRRQKRAAVGGLEWGGILKLPRRGWGEQRIFPDRNYDRKSARGCLRSKTVGGNLSAGSRREEEGDAKPGRRSRAAGTKEADSRRQRMPAPGDARPAALLDRSPALAATNKVYILLRPHPPPPTQDRASPRPPPPNCTRDPEHHPSLPASTTKRHTDRRG